LSSLPAKCSKVYAIIGDGASRLTIRPCPVRRGLVIPETLKLSKNLLKLKGEYDILTKKLLCFKGKHTYIKVITMKKSTLLIVAGIVAVLAMFACAVCFIVGVIALPGEETTVAEATAVIRPEYPTFTPTPVIAQPPAETPQAQPVAPSEEEPQGRTIMYVCGYDRCPDSGEYGNLVFEVGINVWNNPDPDRGGVHHQVAHQDEVVVIGEKRVDDGPGGLWYELEGGGWVNDLWLTDAPCNPDNLSEYTFASCWGGRGTCPHCHASTPSCDIGPCIF
jgi:hypothetical protein